MQKSSVFLVRVQCRRKESTFAISSPDEFLVFVCLQAQWCVASFLINVNTTSLRKVNSETGNAVSDTETDW